MRWICRLLGIDKMCTQVQTKEADVFANKVIDGVDPISESVHKQKSKYNASLLKIQQDIKIVEDQAISTVRDTAYYIDKITAGTC